MNARILTPGAAAAGRAVSLAALLVSTAPLLPARPAAGQGHGPAHAAELGAVDFRVSCEPAVRADFDRAVALLHHMMYESARAAFQAIARRDPECAMAYWGVAMTRFHPLWPARPGPQALAQGWAEVQKAKALAPPTARERDLVSAAEAFYRDPETADWWTRIRRWAAAMEAAHRARPDDVETAAFHALAHLAAGQTADDRMAFQARSAAVLLRIHERAPTHPGAIHYTIHANDVDGRATESQEVVRSYQRIAPNVPHALHMPTHIFVRLGAWPDVIDWNVRSAEAALRAPVGDSASVHYTHALDYLLFAYLQQGEDQKALAVLEEARGRDPYQEGFINAFHLAAMPARYTVERRAWAEAAGLAPRLPASLAWDRYPWAEALTWFARGVGAVQTGELSAARTSLARLGELEQRAEALGEAGWARNIRVDRHVLQGWLAYGEGDREAAVARLRAAVALEESMEKDPVSPGALYPAQEALGDLLLELQRPVEALAAYRASLTAWPNRFNSLLGAARAGRSAGREEEARDYYGRLLEISGETAARGRAGVREARIFLGRGG